MDTDYLDEAAAYQPTPPKLGKITSPVCVFLIDYTITCRLSYFSVCFIVLIKRIIVSFCEIFKIMFYCIFPIFNVNFPLVRKFLIRWFWSQINGF